jgi:hypothetical protein
MDYKATGDIFFSQSGPDWVWKRGVDQKGGDGWEIYTCTLPERSFDGHTAARRILCQ